jgi:hypothetical protein
MSDFSRISHSGVTWNRDNPAQILQCHDFERLKTFYFYDLYFENAAQHKIGRANRA